MTAIETPAGAHAMPPAFTAIVKQDGVWWIGWIEGIPGVNRQEATREALLARLREALVDMLAFNRQDAVTAAGTNYTEVQISL